MAAHFNFFFCKGPDLFEGEVYPNPLRHMASTRGPQAMQHCSPGHFSEPCHIIKMVAAGPEQLSECCTGVQPP